MGFEAEGRNSLYLILSPAFCTLLKKQTAVSRDYGINPLSQTNNVSSLKVV